MLTGYHPDPNTGNSGSVSPATPSVGLIHCNSAQGLHILWGIHVIVMQKDSSVNFRIRSVIINIKHSQHMGEININISIPRPICTCSFACNQSSDYMVASLFGLETSQIH